ncbi:MAG: hypothetical protein ABSG90_07690 [Dehalococcoidia bacterium]|jgi:hypothetical protein
MKVKALATLLALSFLSAFILPVPAAADSLTLEPTQGIVGSDVKIPAFCQYGEGDYFLFWGDGNQLITQGTVRTSSCQPIYFKVPESPRGKHIVTLKVNTKTFQKEYSTLGSIALSAKSGTVDSTISVQGSGFGASETGISIFYDGSAIASGITANANGSWLYTLKIPASSKGNHPISASGSTTPLQEVGNQIFTITPTISLNPASGWVDKAVNISGQGFNSAETNITVIYDSTVVKSGISADLTGTWQTSFSVPASAKGSHIVDAKGATTTIDEVPNFSFTVSPGIKAEQSSGKLGEPINVGDLLFVEGVGFQENEANIQVTFDGMPVATGIVADAHGSWSSQFAVPAATKGDHTVDSFGDTTHTGDVTDYIVVITPQITINPSNGAVGESTVLSGSGFGSSQPLSVIYDSTKTSASGTTDVLGNFSIAFQAPVSGAGTHTITVSDGSHASGSTAFTIESNPPPIPSPISPQAGAKFSMFENKPIDFTWSAVEDPSGVIYTLEIGQKADFSGSVIRKENLDKPQYSLPASERPGAGEYVWRVKASDLAGNTSDWSQSQTMSITGFDFLWIIFVVIGVLAVIAAVIWRIRSISKRGGWSSEPR